MNRLILAVLACLVLAPSLAAQSTVKTDTIFENYVANYDVNGDGTSTSTTEFLMRLNSKAAIESIIPWRQTYNADLQSIEVLEAYTLKQNGKRVLVPAAAIQTQLSPEAEAAPEFSSFKIQSIDFPDVKPGDAVFLKFRLIWRKTFFEGHFDLLETFLVNSLWNSVQINISAPANYSLYWDAVDLDGGKLPDRDGRSRWQWKTKVTQTVEAELGSTSIVDYSPRLVVSSFPNYEALGAAYWAEAGKKVAVTPAVQQLADEITKGINEPEQQARAIYEWVNRNIRYLLILIGRGTFIPHDVSTILKNRYGDCKDYVTILQSLLSAKGIESTPVLVRADDSFWFPKTPTIVYFNHVILHIPSLDIFVDATNPNTAFGLLPQAEIGKSALLAGKKTGEVLIPEGKPNGNQIRSDINLSILDDGGVKAVSSTVFFGRVEMIFRPVFADMKPEIADFFLKSTLRMYGHEGNGKFIEISNSHRTGESFSIKLEFDLVNTVKVPGPGGVKIPQGLDLTSYADFPKLIELRQRKTVLYAGASRIAQQFQLTFPKGVNVSSVPPDVNFVNAAGHYESSYKNENGIVAVKRDLVIDHDVFAPKEYPAFRELITKVVEDINAQILYGPASDYKRPETVAVKKAEKKIDGYAESFELPGGYSLITEAANLSPKKALALESLLLKNPSDVRTRVLLITYYSQATETPKVLQALVRHRKWLIETHPERDFKLIFNPYAAITRPGPEYQALKEAWIKQVDLNKNVPAVLLNAADFLVKRDSQLAESLLQKGQQLEPDDYNWAEELGELYASRADETEGDEKASAYALSIEQYEKALALNKTERSHQRELDRISLLRKLAEVAFDAGQLAKAKQYATELLIEFGRDVSRYSQAEIAHDENVMLGRIALKEGDVAKAREYLMVAGRTAVLVAKQGQVYFMPRMILAKELLEKNEKQVVLEYLDLFDGSSIENSKTIKSWAALIRKGGIPSFNYYAK